MSAAKNKPHPVDFTKARSMTTMGGVQPFRCECDIFDCEVEGTVPESLAGVFYRVGPDPQYPSKVEGNVPFDGEGHMGAFKFKNGRVSFKSRYVRTQRFKAQEKAGEMLFGMYRNPLTDDPRAKGISRGTANTTPWVHHGKLFALKEDSPPVAMDPLTLETLDDYYTFGGKLKSLTSTAHPKIDSETGEMIGFGYEAKGPGTKDVYVYSVSPEGEINWEAWIEQPHCSELHDFAVTDRHVAFLVIPLAYSQELIDRGGPHWLYDSNLPSYLGVMRRGGDGSDIVWFKGPERMATHTMGAFSDGDRFYFDMDMGSSNQFPFFPNKDGSSFNPETGMGWITRMSVDLSDKTPRSYEMEVLYPDICGFLPRQDDRYHTVAYRYGFMPHTDFTKPLPQTGNGFPPFNSWAMFDHAKKTHESFYAGPDSVLQEMCFAPRSPNAPEGDGYLVGVCNRLAEQRSDLLIADTKALGDGPVGVVKMPFRLWGQVHGFWADASTIPGWA